MNIYVLLYNPTADEMRLWRKWPDVQDRLEKRELDAGSVHRPFDTNLDDTTQCFQAEGYGYGHGRFRLFPQLRDSRQ